MSFKFNIGDKVRAFRKETEHFFGFLKVVLQNKHRRQGEIRISFHHRFMESV